MRLRTAISLGTALFLSLCVPTAPSAVADTPRQEILRLVNDARLANGCGRLTAAPRLNALAQDLALDMEHRRFFAHTTPDGRSAPERAKAAGVTDFGGENIARGHNSPEEVMTAWLDSPGHRANILNCDFHDLGVGLNTHAGGPWWVQDFGY